LNCGLHSFCWKTIWTEVKFLHSLVFKSWIQTNYRFSARRTPLHVIFTVTIISISKLLYIFTTSLDFPSSINAFSTNSLTHQTTSRVVKMLSAFTNLSVVKRLNTSNCFYQFTTWQPEMHFVIDKRWKTYVAVHPIIGFSQRSRVSNWICHLWVPNVPDCIEFFGGEKIRTVRDFNCSLGV